MEEVIQIGSMFAGVGVMILFSMFAYFIYQFSRYIKMGADLEERYNIFEILSIGKIATKKGFNLEKELIKKNFVQERRKSFRRELNKEIVGSMFEEKKDGDK